MREGLPLNIYTMSPHLISQNASEFIVDALKGAFLSSQLTNYTTIIDEPNNPPAWQTWGVGLLVLCGCSFSAPLGMIILPCLSASLYERAMIFLIALGIGALSGSCFFVMIPQAFQLTSFDEIDYISKSWLIISALYTFLIVDRALQYLLEHRRKRQAKRKIHASTLNKIVNGGKMRQITEQTDVDDDREKKEKEVLQNELELSMVNNAFARTFSTRRRVAMVKRVDDIEFIADHRNHNSTHSKGSIDTNHRHLNGENNISNEDRSSHHHIKLPVKDHSHSPLGTRKAHKIEPNQFLDQVNNQVMNHLQPLDRRHSIGATTNDLSRQQKKKDDDEISVSIQIVDKRIVNTAEVEIASVAYMIIFGSSANNFVDGMSMGAAFADSLLRGLSIGIAVLSQQFPQELGTLAILVNSGLGLRKTLLLNLIPTSLSFIGFSVGVFLDNIDDSYDTYIFAISSGMYLYIFLGTLIPEIRDSANELIRTNIIESLIVSGLQCAGITSGIFFMFYMGKFSDISLE